MPTSLSRGGKQEESGLSAYLPLLRPYLARRVPRDQVDDLLQETMLRLHQRRTDFAISNLSAYAFQTARSVIVDRVRRDGAKKRDTLSGYIDAPHAIEHITPEQIALGKEALQRFTIALQELPERTRDIFVLHRFEEMSYPQIGEHLNISLSSVGKHIVKALRLLAQKDLP